MISFSVSFEITTGLADLDGLSATVGKSPGPSSHEKGRNLRTGEPTPTVWKLESSASKDASLEEHLDSVYLQLAELDFTDIARLPADADIYLNIAMFTPNPMGSVVIPRRYLELARDIPMDLVSSCYFCEEEDTSGGT